MPFMTESHRCPLSDPISASKATMRLLRPEDNFAETLRSGVTSAFADVPTEEAMILVLRSTITSNFKFRLLKLSDPAASASPLATLTGLSVLDGQGPLPMRPMYFDPQRSQYLAFAQLNTGGPGPVDQSVSTEGYIEVPRHAWLQVEIEVASPTTAVLAWEPGESGESSGVGLVYEILITRELLCHVMCRTCYGPKDTQCLSCRDARMAPCVLRCSTGRFAHPKSRRCRKPPTAPESVVNTTAFVLGLSLSDVRAYRLEPLKELNGIMLEDYLPQMMVEVVSPFLLKDEADAILVDLWFGAFEVPLDEVTSFTWDEVHPPLPPLPLEPFLPVWLWGLITSASSAVVMLIPLYCCYFRRLSSTRRKYRPTAGVDPSFMEKVVAQSDPRVVRRFVAREAGAQLLRDSD
ncbi:unnamed protein product [Durusdinium trenchii]|uniref:PSI domain-containing protein n=1 Tax=Durusdinium trenchii TaxID=1381693 RepID=A0ABP0SXL5_9DINO